jgi:hypothetical protein
MNKQHLTVNSKSSGKFTEEVFNGRNHLVTKMVSIEGDSVMNGWLYPFGAVSEAHGQLNDLHAPAGHPMVDGEYVSASSPMAVNSYNIGASVKNPQMSGAFVVNDLAIDIEVAERTEQGREAMSRIRSGDKIGVSTGLTATTVNKAGEMNGKSYTGIVQNIEFDHVAILLKEPPAGENTFTVNEQQVFSANVADSMTELRREVEEAAGKLDYEFLYVEEIFFNPQTAVIAVRKDTENEDTYLTQLLSVPFEYDFAGNLVFSSEPKEVEAKTTYSNQQEEAEMDREKLVLAVIGNSANAFTGDDKDKLLAMSESQLINALCKAPSFDDAQAIIEAKGFSVNQIGADEAANYLANKDAFGEWQKSESLRLEGMADQIVAVNGCKFTKDELLGMGEDGMLKINSLMNPGQDFSVQGAITTNAQSSTLSLHEEA